MQDNKNRENLLFEINDYVLFVVELWIVVLMMTMVLGAYIYEGYDISKALLSGGSGRYPPLWVGLLIMSLRQIPVLGFMLFKKKKLMFYPDMIKREQGDITLNFQDIKEAYLVSVLFNNGKVRSEKRLGPIQKPFLIIGLIIMFLLAPAKITFIAVTTISWFVVTIFLTIFIAGLVNQRFSLSTKTLLLVGKNGRDSISIPLALIDTSDYDKVISYMKKNLNIEPKNLEKINLKISKTPKENFNIELV